MSGKFRKWKHTLMCLGSEQAAKMFLIDMYFVIANYVHVYDIVFIENYLIGVKDFLFVFKTNS